LELYLEVILSILVLLCRETSKKTGTTQMSKPFIASYEMQLACIHYIIRKVNASCSTVKNCWMITSQSYLQHLAKNYQDKDHEDNNVISDDTIMISVHIS